MKTTNSPLVVQRRALESADRFTQLADGASSANEAKDWSFAAKNIASVAVSCESILTMRNGKARR